MKEFTRHQLRLEAIKCVQNGTSPTCELPKSYLDWFMIQYFFSAKLSANSPVNQAREIIKRRALFGEVVVTLFDLNIKGFACLDAARGELCIAALNAEKQ